MAACTLPAGVNATPLHARAELAELPMPLLQDVASRTTISQKERRSLTNLTLYTQVPSDLASSRPA